MKKLLSSVNDALAKSPLILFLPLVVINGLIMMLISPVAYYPDERVHFAYSNHILSKGKVPKITDALSPRNSMLAMDFTNHDMHINGDKGFAEELINTARLPGSEEFPEMITHRAAIYPSAYYAGGALLTAISPVGSSIFNQFSFLRFYSLVLWILTIWAAAQVVRNIFPQSVSYQAMALSMVAFNPMFVSIGISVNSDILAIFIMTVIIWRCLVLIQSETWRRRNTLFTFILSVCAIGIKPQLVIALPLFFAAFLFQQLKHPGDRLSKKAFALGGAGLALLFIGGSIAYSLIFKAGEGDAIYHIVNFEGGTVSLLSFELTKFYRIFVLPLFGIPDYGVYATNFFRYWVYITPGLEARYFYPDIAFIMVLRVMVLCAICGWVYKLSRRTMLPAEGFLVFTTVLWWFWIITMTWFLFDRVTHLQGRYFFPVIAASMPAILIGLDMFPKKAMSYITAVSVIFMMLFYEHNVLKLLVAAYK